MKKGLSVLSLLLIFTLAAAGCGNGEDSGKTAKSTAESTSTESTSSEEESEPTREADYKVVYRIDKDTKKKTVIASGYDLKIETVGDTLVNVKNSEGTYYAQQNITEKEEVDIEKLGKGDLELIVRINDSIIATGENLLIMTTSDTLVNVKDEDGSYLAQKSIERGDVVSIHIDGEDSSDSDTKSSSSSSSKSDTKTSSSSSKSSSASKDTLHLYDGDYVGGDSYLPAGRYDLEFTGSGYNDIHDDEDLWENNNGGGEKIHGITIVKGTSYSISGEITLKKSQPPQNVDGTYSLYAGEYIGGEDLPAGTYDLEFTGKKYNDIHDDEDLWENNNGGDERYHGIIIQEGVTYYIDGELNLTLLQ